MQTDLGRPEMRQALQSSRNLFIATFVFSFFVNALMLTGPIYMLQVYDRVLGSRSEETLFALSLLVAFLYLTMGMLDYARGRIMALSPIEQAIAQWPLVQRAQQGWGALIELLKKSPPQAPRTPLPVSKAILDMQQVTIVPPGDQQAALRMMTFRIEPGQAVGVIGKSGAGKSTLARAIAGVWPVAGGKIRLDGATIDQYDPDTLGGYIGYLPQKVTLFYGTIAENIARLSTSPDSKPVIEAAIKAGAHDLIVQMPDGYGTRVSAHGGRLSGGQVQRVGLARAMYGNPVILVLDEPNSNLDSVGSDALNEAIRTMKSEGKSVIIMAHRPAAIAECDMLLVIEDGLRKAFGPRDEVLQAQVQNAKQITKSMAVDKQPA